jgi:hypothetical protein
MLTVWVHSRHSTESETDDLEALADRLKAPMTAQSHQLKRQITEAIVPAVKRIMVIHDRLEEEGESIYAAVFMRYNLQHGITDRPYLTVDMAYGTGLLAFDEVCKRVEAMALRTEDELRSEYIESKVTSLLSHACLATLNWQHLAEGC